MKAKRRVSRSLSQFVDSLQESGRYTFTREEASRFCGGSEVALRAATARLERQGRLATLRRGFYVVVPLEYRTAGAPPPSWYIDALMRFHGRPYYVGLLTAAALHGAAHQQVQEFQVVTDRAFRPVHVGRVLLRFFYKKNTAQTPRVGVKVETGTMQVSSPEATVFDLVRYPLGAGGLGNIVTVLAELAERIDPERLVEATESGAELAVAQRVGLLLESVGAENKTEPLAEWVASRKPRTVSLRPDRDAAGAPQNRRWHVLVNDAIELEP